MVLPGCRETEPRSTSFQRVMVVMGSGTSGIRRGSRSAENSAGDIRGAEEASKLDATIAAKATLVKGAEEGDFLKQQSPDAPMKGHCIVLRHQTGEDWYDAVIEHLGTTATVKAAGTPAPGKDFAKGEKTDVADTLKSGGGWVGVRNYSSYHNDTDYRPYRAVESQSFAEEDPPW